MGVSIVYENKNYYPNSLTDINVYYEFKYELTPGIFARVVKCIPVFIITFIFLGVIFVNYGLSRISYVKAPFDAYVTNIL